MSGKGSLSLILTGDVMLGRGIDQIQRFPSHPHLYENYVKSAETYVELAEQVNGAIPRRVNPDYIWGDALNVMERDPPDIRIINLETSITDSGTHAAAKGIHYRMHPNNIDCIAAAKIDCCVLANNHVLDWGQRGLLDTLDTLDAAGIGHAGAGRNRREARAPWIKEVPGKGRVLVFGVGHGSSGVPRSWAAGEITPGVAYISDLTEQAAGELAERIDRERRDGDFIIVSVHWGPNWGYQIDEAQTAFAHALIDTAGVDLIHGHSGHHRKAAEVYKGRLILYDCGDFINDYEGIQGNEAFRPDLMLMYRLSLDVPEKRLTEVQILPFRLRKFRLEYASPEDTAWLADVLGREYGRFGASVRLDDAGKLTLALP